MGALADRMKKILAPEQIVIQSMTVSPELAETNRLLARIANALEAVVLHAFNVDLGAPPLTPAEISEAEKTARDDNEVDDEILAAIEMLEDAKPGQVPIEVYRHFRIEPPENRRDPGEITEEQLNAEQPKPKAVRYSEFDAEDDEPPEPEPPTKRGKFDVDTD